MIASSVGAVVSTVIGIVDAANMGARAANGACVGIGIALGIGAWFCFKWDTARRKEASELRANLHFALAERDQERSIVDALADGLDVAIFVCDAKANVLHSNRRARSLFALNNAAGKTLVQLTLSYELERLVQAASVQNSESTVEELTFSYPSEIVGRCKAWVSDTLPERVYVSIYDITDLRRLERVRRDFVANVSHELRTPLTLMRTMAETLLDPNEPLDKREKYLSRIIDEVDRLSSIAQDLLELTSAESNPVRKQACDLVQVTTSVVGQFSEKAHERGLGLTFEGPDSLVIAANPQQMTQVLINLVDNALNYTVTGGVALRVYRHDDLAVVSISDTGLGISSEHVGRVFERFYRIDKARSRGTGGTGLGLSIVRHIIEAHGGTVTLQSTLNVGSTFTISLPVE